MPPAGGTEEYDETEEVFRSTESEPEGNDYALPDPVSAPIPMCIAIRTRSGCRQQASAYAQLTLDQHKHLKEPISDGAVLAVLRAWSCAKNYGGSNITPNGDSSVASQLFGAVRTRGYPFLYSLTTVTRDYASVAALCNQWLRDRLPPLTPTAGDTSGNGSGSGPQLP